MGFYIYASTQENSNRFNQSVKIAASAADVVIYTATVFMSPCVLINLRYVFRTAVHAATLFGLNENSGRAVFELEMLVPVPTTFKCCGYSHDRKSKITVIKTTASNIRTGSAPARFSYKLISFNSFLFDLFRDTAQASVNAQSSFESPVFDSRFALLQEENKRRRFREALSR